MTSLHGARVLIFGASGQDGHYLEKACRTQGATVCGVSRRTSPACDVADFARVQDLVQSFRPDYIYHLAAESSTSHAATFANHAAIGGGTLHVLESVKLHAPAARVVIAGSALQFRNDGQAIDERAPFEARSSYAAARNYATYLARYYRREHGVATVMAYLFHHESPLRSMRHTSQMIAMAAATAASGAVSTATLGDPLVEKEWTFAGDVVEALLLLSMQNDISECVVGSGEGHTIADWAEACFRSLGLDWRDHLPVRQGFVSEYRRLVSNPATLRSLGWLPRVGFAELADQMVRACRAELEKKRETS